MKLQNIITFITVLVMLLACTQEKKNRDYTLEGPIFGTSYKIKYYNTNINFQKSLDSLFIATENGTLIVSEIFDENKYCLENSI